MANLENTDDLNVSDILQSPTKDNASISSNSDFLNEFLNDNDAENAKTPNESNPSDLDLNDDDGTGLPSFLLPSDDNQEQPEVNQEHDQLNNFDNLENHENIDQKDLSDGLDQPEKLEQNNLEHPDTEQLNDFNHTDGIEEENHEQVQIDQNKEDIIQDDQDETGLPEIEDINDNGLNENNEEENHNSVDLNNESDDGVEVLNQNTNKAQTVQSPSDSKTKQRDSKSFQEFLERNDNCFQRHYHKEVQRPPSPKTIRYRNTGPVSPKFHSPEPKKIPEKLQTERLNELFESSMKKGPCNSNYPTKSDDKNNNETLNSSKQTTSSNQKIVTMSEASTTLANSKFDRIIDLTVGKKANLTKIQVYGILRKFYIKNEKDRSEILKSCGDDDENGNQDNENDANKQDDENNEENNDENKTYSAESLKKILKQAASAEGGNSFIRKIRPTVKAAIFDMKQPIVSPMTQKQRNAMKFDETLRTSLRKQSPKH